MKKILGLDLGTTSIGWALVNESENENSSIIRTGVRVVPLSTDEENDFKKGNTITINADRTLKRGARRNLQRYKLRRDELIKVLKENSIIKEGYELAEEGKSTTHSLWRLRARAAIEKIDLIDFARVILAINKKRGYKSNRKAKDEGDGMAIDGMEVAIKLYNEGDTPGQYVFQLLNDEKKHIPDFYRSDLQNEFDKIWQFQKRFYPEILSDELKENLKNKNKGQTWKICEEPFEIVGIKQKGTAKEKRLEQYKWRNEGLQRQLNPEELAIVFQEINNQINNSSGYLGDIGDRSKKLIIDKQTVGQFLYKQLQVNPHARLKNQVFYRQDYLDEFEKLWEVQSKYYNELTTELKKEIRDVVIFYQRRLKSQKGLISICELEGRDVELELNGKMKKCVIGPRVIPKSSPLFQEYKIWQNLNNIKFHNLLTNEKFEIKHFDEDLEIRELMFEELNIRGKLTAKEVLKATFDKPTDWELTNFKEIQGNETNAVLYSAYQQIVELSGHDVKFKNLSASEVKKVVYDVFSTIGIKTDILEFDAELGGEKVEQQASYKLWHLLYSYEGDDSLTGNVSLIKHLKEKFGFKLEYAQKIINISFKDDYGSLSARAIKKIMPYLSKGNEYSVAAALAGYNHSGAITKEDNKKRELKSKLDLLPRNSLRNPVVEKILNQMVNVINAIFEEYGKPDEIRIELARELKKSAKERKEATQGINRATKNHVRIKNEIAKLYPFNTGIRITRTDIIKYKLWEELASVGHKTIYTNTYIPLDKLFSKEFDIEHIIPKAVLFDDSFSNKTLSKRDFNLFKSDKTGLDAVVEKFGEQSEDYLRYVKTIEKLYKDKVISRAKYNKLLMKQSQIPDGFIERDLRNSQYIAKKARQMLYEVVRVVTPVTGSITAKLRDDWQLTNVLQELNWDKYSKLNLTTYESNKDGKQIPKIIDWSKRNDQRHHAMDAIAIAFTKHNHIQYYNYLNARRDENHKKHSNIYAIEQKETFLNSKNKRLIKPPMPLNVFRKEAKKNLENVLISFKAKNKVVTRNKNKTRKKEGFNTTIELTPRGQLHKETVYGKSMYYKTKIEKVGPKFTEDIISKVAIKEQREALLGRLKNI
jgi:CRISPR-associated endonuclease Csn1